MELNRINVYVIMQISMQNLELYLSGTQKSGRPGGKPEGAPPPSSWLFFIRKYYIFSRILEKLLEIVLFEAKTH